MAALGPSLGGVALVFFSSPCSHAAARLQKRFRLLGCKTLTSAELAALDVGLPRRLMETSLRVVRPLYGLTPDGIGMVDQAPILTEHRAVILDEARPGQGRGRSDVGGMGAESLH